MNQRIPKIAHLLRRWCAEQSGRTCEAMFIRFMEDVLTKGEAKRFFEVYMNEPILKFYSSRMCTITVHQDHFNDKAVEEVASSINLAEKIDSRYGKTKSEISEKPSLPSRKKKEASKNLSEFSDEELYAELQRRDEERRAAERRAHVKDLLDEFLTTWEITKEDVLEYLEVI